jgi:hypothetical protein
MCWQLIFELDYILFKCLKSKKKRNIYGSGKSSEFMVTNVYRLTRKKKKYEEWLQSKDSPTRMLNIQPFGPLKIVSSTANRFSTYFPADSSTKQSPFKMRIKRRKSMKNW